MNLEEQERELARRAKIIGEYETLLARRWRNGRPAGLVNSLVRSRFGLNVRTIQRWREVLPRERRRLARLARGQLPRGQRAVIGRRRRMLKTWSGAGLSTLYRWRRSFLAVGVLGLIDGRSRIVVRVGGGHHNRG